MLRLYGKIKEERKMINIDKCKKYILIFTGVCLIAFGIYQYTINEGVYLLKRLTCDELDLINEYAIYNYEFPSTTVIEKFELFNDYDSNFLNHSQAIKATLLVPNNEMDKLFPQEIRDYDGIYTSDLSHGKTNEKVLFGVWLPRTVQKWFVSRAQQDVMYTVMEPGKDKTRVYLLVDKLGWRLTRISRLQLEEHRNQAE